MELGPLLYQAALAGDVPSLLTIIHDDPTSIHPIQLTSLGDTIAHIAALMGHADFIKEIVSRNPLLVREVNQQGCSPLHLASNKGRVEVVEELLRGGNDLCLVRDKDGKLPVHVAAMAGNLDVLEKLMEVDPDCLKRLTVRDETILHLAVKGNQMQVIQFLARSTFNYSELLNMKDDKGDTALHFAAAGRSKEMTRFLLSSKGIEVNTENKKGETPLGVILSLLPQGGGAAQEVNDIIRTAGGLPTNPRSVVDIGLAPSASSPPPPATQETEESDAQWLKDMRKSLMIVAALIATITFEAGVSKRNDDNTNDSAASAPSVNYNEGPRSYDHYVYLGMAFRLVNMVSLFSSLTVILLLLTKYPVEKKYLVFFLSKKMHLSIFSVGTAFLIIASANNLVDKHKEETIVISIFWIGWFYLTCYAVVNGLASVPGYFVRRLGLKRFVTPKSKFLAFLLKWLRVILSLLCALALFWLSCWKTFIYLKKK